jgi:hypothetical protein
MKEILEDLVFNKLNFEFEENNYIDHDKLSPSLQYLREKDPELADILVKLTGKSEERGQEKFRQKVINSLIPLLPNVSNECSFLHRRINEGDLREYKNFNCEVFSVTNGFLAFYSNGQDPLVDDIRGKVNGSSTFFNALLPSCDITT